MTWHVLHVQEKVCYDSQENLPGVIAGRSDLVTPKKHRPFTGLILCVLFAMGVWECLTRP